MTRTTIIVLALLALGALGTTIATKIYLSGRADERAAASARAKGMQAEKDKINAAVRNATTEQRCLRNGLEFVPDANGGHCN